jgi:hypothetical protein
MRHKLSFRKIFWVSFACGLTLFSQPALAQQSFADLVGAVNALRASIDSVIATAATYMFQTPSNIGNEVVSNYALNTAVQTIPPNVLSLGNQDIQTGLAPDVKNPNKNLLQLTNVQAVDTVLQSTTLGGVPVPFFSSATSQSQQDALTQGNLNFNFESLVSPPNLVYNTPTLQTHAANYIRFISGFGTPISNINLNSETQLSAKQKLDIQNSANYQTYMVQRRQFIAQQSAALSNLYRIYQSRLPIQTIKSADTPLAVDNPSSAQIANYNATWRTASPTWYTQMGTASQSNVEKELLFVLAELQVELHKLHLDNERMIALTSVSQLASLQTAKQSLAISEKQVQDTINQQLRQNVSQGTNQPGKSNQGQVNQLKQSQQQVQAVQQQTSRNNAR